MKTVLRYSYPLFIISILLVILVISIYQHAILLMLFIIVPVIVAIIAKNYQDLSIDKIINDRFTIYGIILMIGFNFQTYWHNKSLKEQYEFVYNSEIRATIVNIEKYRMTIKLDLSNHKSISFTSANYRWFYRQGIIGDSIYKKSDSDTLNVIHDGVSVPILITKPND